MAPSDGGGFVWTPGARRSVNVLVAMQAMHMCASQVVELASEDLLVTLVQKVFREKPELVAERDEKRRKLGESPDAEALEKVEAEFDEQIKVKANSRAAYIMSTVQVVIALGDFVIGPILGAAADAYGRKSLVLIAPAVQGIFRAAIALRPSVNLFVAFQMVQGITNIMYVRPLEISVLSILPPFLIQTLTRSRYGRVIQLMIGDIVPRHTFEYQRVGGLSSKVNTVLGLIFMLVGGRVSLRTGFLSSALLSLGGFLALSFFMTDTLRVADRVPFTAKNAHPFSFIRFFNRSPMLRRIGIFALISEAPNFEGYEGLFFIHKWGWMKQQRTWMQIVRRSIHYFNFNCAPRHPLCV